MNTFTSIREIYVAPPAVFAAIKDPARLTKWWGPDGFSSRFEVLGFEPGGKMIGPDGKVYPNESVFVSIEADRQVVIRHLCPPCFTLTIMLEPMAEGSLVRWQQAFADAALADAIRHIVVPANGQNLDRLNADVGPGQGAPG